MRRARDEQDHSAALDRILQLGLGFAVSKVLFSAVRLGLFTELAARPLPYEELRDRLGLHPRAARDFLDTLVALDLLERGPEGYGNTPVTARYLDRNRATYLGGFLEMTDHRLYGFWGTLLDGLRTGEPQNEIKHGGDFFGTLYQDPVRRSEFLQAMTGLSMRSAHALADAVDWSAHRVVADVGCAEGGTLGQILLRHPHLRGTGFDLESARGDFDRRAERFGLADRLTFAAGDFFTDPLPRADALLLGHILHDWDLPTKRMLLRKAYEALPAGGVVIVYETLIDDDRRTHLTGLLMSLNMLVETTGGFDYTGAECREWLAGAGFAESRVQHLAGPESMVIARK
ncbi:acetylserotonin O-methyltransferase [Streptomyces sp. HU2014]|uniref:O-methyltransferase n=1 Tax=Streptomyces albireticuli TaxID=1940 RepID=A0A1Z2L8U9_9ACTN|nr:MULTISPECIES: methyltransferase [Streptomyces]ARZ70725.1 o-methyltransferase [Streptomyces albireticuli]UQI44215.1 acetylserotonin O-methyltransferase [Streptomyces sp. HU2014]